ncbi:tspO/peripheral benzodiazepine receptor [Schizosaccharomyces cryophilus OY26]|uniref:TspO/peripheral benzodiazepine receptor n=1 Tax=Schizosaccharomyces cryophilus (strain OY26 / ATCC MYA-4695 / CBS 11777 / NBRC 106824 / NRRL Y48691) TaxID=653667 RepID=S9VTG6_SCHCR|nr:tspO/peripheral benzodiazepine receptor [Schizosaccharomyces cryophilus OY26]EPY49335.1 tspO/peripheral benzodiazepine receptor [Schizosaccharomyces cryophilus OY26]
MDLNYRVFTSISQTWWIAGLVPTTFGWITAGLNKNKMDRYKTRKQPKFQAPDYVFGPAWTILYFAMGYASHLAYQADPLLITNAGRKGAALYLTQLALNYSWMPLFCCQKPKLALLNIGALTGVVGWLAKTWWPIAPTASKILVPYLAWLAYAGYLVSA